MNDGWRPQIESQMAYSNVLLYRAQGVEYSTLYTECYNIVFATVYLASLAGRAGVVPRDPLISVFRCFILCKVL